MSFDTITPPATPPADQPAARTGAVPLQSRPELAELRDLVSGAVHLPGEDDWDLARSPWAVQVAQQPLAVVEVADADDVRRCVQWAR